MTAFGWIALVALAIYAAGISKAVRADTLRGRR